MTIKRRFLISYIGGITIACLSLIAILGISFYVTTGEIESPGKLYRSFTKQRSLSPEEEQSYIRLRTIAKETPEELLTFEGSLFKEIQTFEGQSLGIVIRKNQTMTYYSKGLVEKSLIVHFPSFDENNIELRGTMDNAGRLYRYMKYDFYFDHHIPGSLLVLKKENTMLDFMTKWGILICVVIVGLSVAAVLFFTRLLRKTVIHPLEELGKEMSTMTTGILEEPKMRKRIIPALEIKKLTDDFDEMRQALYLSTAQQKKLENNRKELVASISHDLKTPITSIIGYVEGLLDGVANTPEKQQRYLKTIQAKAHSLNDQIEALFLFSKLDVDAMPFHFEKIDIIEFMNHRIQEFQFQEERIDCRLLMDTKGPVYVNADRLQLNRVIVNIIENSRKFSSKDRPLSIEINVKQLEENKIELSITDNGQGIPKEQLPYVFDHFYRVEKERSTQMGGSGLGLAIVKQIIERHSGKVTIDSQYLKGTAVAIQLNQVRMDES